MEITGDELLQERITAGGQPTVWFRAAGVTDGMREHAAVSGARFGIVKLFTAESFRTVPLSIVTP
jgi:hypothetical protein